MVLLLGIARLELENRMGPQMPCAGAAARQRSGNPRIRPVPSPSRVERWIDPASDVLNDPVSVNETR